MLQAELALLPKCQCLQEWDHAHAKEETDLGSCVQQQSPPVLCAVPHMLFEGGFI